MSEVTLDEWLEDSTGITGYRKDLHNTLAHFYRWGTNYDPSDNPFNIFRDIVGWSEEVTGTTLYTDSFSSIGYLEAHLVAEGLELWATYPLEVELWLNTLDGLENA